MARFRLKVGQHIQADPDWKPGPHHPPNAKPPSRTYSKGEIVESNIDLVARFGPDKFVLLSGTPDEYASPAAGAERPVAPGGQVSSGKQVATGTPEGTVSGLDTGKKK